MKVSLFSSAVFAALATTALAATAASDDNTVFLTPSNTGAYPTGTILPAPNESDINGSNATYDFPTKMFQFPYWGHVVDIIFIDSKPCCMDNKKVILMLHGKNYFCNTWRFQIAYFNLLGYTVIAPDGVCFGKSSKYPGIQLSVNWYCWVWVGLIKALGYSKVHLMGHSWGGMQATHCAFLYPQYFDIIVVLDAVGLEDYTVQGVNYLALDSQLAQEESSTEVSILQYEKKYYFPNTEIPWLANQTAHDLANIYSGSHRRNYTMCQALVVDLVLSNTIINDYPYIGQPFLLIVGEDDHTIIGVWAPASITANLGNFPEIGKKACDTMKNCTFVIVEGQGHSDQVADPPGFNKIAGTWLELAES